MLETEVRVNKKYQVPLHQIKTETNNFQPDHLIFPHNLASS